MFDNRDSRFFCTAVLSRLSPSQRWWFSSCTTCHKSSLPDGAAYRCSDPACAGIDAIPRYRMCYVARDDDAEVNEPGEAEFVFFDRVGRELVGAPLISLLRHGRSPVAPLQEIVQSARGDPFTPRELSAVVSRKFRFVVSISSKCFTSDDDDLSFQVLRIDTPLGKQPQSSVAYRASSVTTGATSSSSLPHDGPSMVPPGASFSNLTPGTSTAPPSVATTPEAQALLPVLLSPPSVTKPSVTGGMVHEVKLKSQRALFKDKVPVSTVSTMSDPVDNELDDLADDNLGTGSVTEPGELPQLGASMEQLDSPKLDASIEKDNIALAETTSESNRFHASVPAEARGNTSKRGKKRRASFCGSTPFG